MGTMTDGARSVGANAKVDNILSGKLEEFVTRPSLVRVRACAAAAGVRMTVLAGGHSVVDDQEISQANRWPLFPDDGVAEFGLTGPSDRLVIALRNTTAGAIVVNTVVDVIPL